MDHQKTVYVLDGDNVRHGLCKDLGFEKGDREENIRRIGEVCSLFTDAGLIVLAAFVSPYKENRDKVRALFASEQKKSFIEIYVKAGEGVAICESRDPKSLYAKARSGVIPSFTGISAPYEAPLSPEIVLDTSKLTVDECVQTLIDYLQKGRYLGHSH